VYPWDPFCSKLCNIAVGVKVTTMASAGNSFWTFMRKWKFGGSAYKFSVSAYSYKRLKFLFFILDKLCNLNNSVVHLTIVGSIEDAKIWGVFQVEYFDISEIVNIFINILLIFILVTVTKLTFRGGRMWAGSLVWLWGRFLISLN